MQTGPGTTGKTLAGRGVVDGRVPGAGHLTSPAWTDTRQDTGAASKAALTTVARYRAGVRPDWAKDGDGDSEEEEEEEELPAQAAPAIERRPDDRLGRLAARERDIKGPEIVRRRRERDDSDEEEAERPTPSGRGRAQQEEPEEEEDDDEIERRREMARLRCVNQQLGRFVWKGDACSPISLEPRHARGLNLLPLIAIRRRKQMEEQEELAKVEDEEDEEEAREPYKRRRFANMAELAALLL